MVDEIHRKMARAIRDEIRTRGNYALAQLNDTTRPESMLDDAVFDLAFAALNSLTRADVEALLRRPTLK